MKKNLKLFYAPGGPGNVIGTYKQWVEGLDEAKGDVSVAFSAQFFDLCKNRNAPAYIVSPTDKKGALHDGQFYIEHRPKPKIISRGGIWFYVGEALYALGLIRTCINKRITIAVVADNPVWPVWAVARLFGIKIIAVLHCALWPSGFRPNTRVQRFLQTMIGKFWKSYVDATVAVSEECLRQVRELSPDVKTPMVVGLSLFRQKLFSNIPDPPLSRNPFRIMFAGRIERSKGVFDLLVCAEKLELESKGEFVWDVCGDGGAMSELKAAVQQRGLENVFQIAGRLSQEEMLAHYGMCHAVIVPTTSSFAEGLNQVSIESILAGRPLVSSRLCNGLDFFGNSVLEVRPDNIDDYIDAVKMLRDDYTLYESKRALCAELSRPFVSVEYSWGRQLGKCIDDICNK